MQAQNANAASTGAAGYNAAQVDPNQNQGYIQQYEGLVAQGLQPQFQQQDQALQASLAGRGISSSGSAQQLSNDLSGQQAAALAAADAPVVSQGYGYTQQDIQGNQAAQNTALGTNAGYQQQANLTNAGYQQQTGLANQAAQNAAGALNAGNEQQANLSNQAAGNTAAQYNAGNQQQANQYNAGSANTAAAYNASNQQQIALANQNAANAASGTNAQYYNEALTGNANAYNQYLATLEQQGSGLGNTELGAYLNSYGPNTGVQSLQNTGESGALGTYGNVFGQQTAAQGQALGAAGTAFGEFA